MTDSIDVEYDYPVFPLHTVLFPGCKIALRIFEQRYLRMIRESMREGKPFVISLIKGQGSEVGDASECHEVGTLAQVLDFNQGPNGMLDIVAQGGDRVRILNSWHEQDKLLRARLERYEEAELQDVPDHYQSLVSMLLSFKRDVPELLPDDVESLSATQASFLLANLAPVSTAKKQKLLVLQDNAERLAELQAIFSQTTTGFTA